MNLLVFKIPEYQISNSCFKSKPTCGYLRNLIWPPSQTKLLGGRKVIGLNSRKSLAAARRLKDFGIHKDDDGDYYDVEKKVTKENEKEVTEEEREEAERKKERAEVSKNLEWICLKNRRINFVFDIFIEMQDLSHLSF